VLLFKLLDAFSFLNCLQLAAAVHPCLLQLAVSIGSCLLPTAEHPALNSWQSQHTALTAAANNQLPLFHLQLLAGDLAALNSIYTLNV